MQEEARHLLFERGHFALLPSRTRSSASADGTRALWAITDAEKPLSLCPRYGICGSRERPGPGNSAPSLCLWF